MSRGQEAESEVGQGQAGQERRRTAETLAGSSVCSDAGLLLTRAPFDDGAPYSERKGGRAAGWLAGRRERVEGTAMSAGRETGRPRGLAHGQLAVLSMTSYS